MRRFYPEEYGEKGVTPQQYLRDIYNKAESKVALMRDEERRAKSQEMLKEAGVLDEIDSLKELYKSMTGNHLDMSWRNLADPESPIGKEDKKIQDKYDSVMAELLDAWQQASLRLNLGKDADSIMLTLKDFKLCIELTIVGLSQPAKRKPGPERRHSRGPGIDKFRRINEKHVPC